MKFSALGCIAVTGSFLLVSCSSTSPVDTDEATVVIGRESDVRVHARITSGSFSRSSTVSVACEVENLRKGPILVADFDPGSDYDSATRTITLTLGSEIPRSARLVRIESGQKKSFHKGVMVRVAPSRDMAMRQQPRYVRLKVNFLGDAEPFATLEAQRELVAGGRHGDELFPSWVEHNEAVFTNSVPIAWDRGAALPSISDASTRSRSPF